MENINNWVLGFWEQSTDFLLWSAETLPELSKQDTIRYQYNQWSSNDCTIYSPVWALSDLMNYKFTADEIKEINELSYTRWRTRWEWWYVQSWVKCVCDWWNEQFPNNPVAYYRIDLIDTELLEEITKKNYTVCTGYQWNLQYNMDFITDWILNWVNFGKATYGHAVSIIDNNWKRSIKDNYYPREYKWKQVNIYEVEHTFKELVESKVYYTSAYVIVKIQNEERLKELKRLNVFKQDVEQAIELNSKMWLESTEKYEPTDPKWFRYKMHQQNEFLRMKLKDIAIEMNKFSL